MISETISFKISPKNACPITQNIQIWVRIPWDWVVKSWIYVGRVGNVAGTIVQGWAILEELYCNTIPG